MLTLCTGLAVGSIIAIPLLAESKLLAEHPALKFLFMPFMLIWPWGPPLLAMTLAAVAGRSRSMGRIAARAAAALLFYIPLALFMMGYAFSGRFVFEGTDAEVSVAAVALGSLLAWFGFTGRRHNPDADRRLAKPRRR